MHKDRRALFLNFFLLFLGFSLLTRLTLLVMAWPELDGGLPVLVKIFAAGLLYDCAAFSYAGAALALYLLLLPEKLYAAAWHRLAVYGLFLAAAFLLAFNLAAEYYFFYEFGVRYNFIAVDYLVYTSEVVGNIRESYNLPVVLPLVALLSGAALWLFGRRLSFSFAEPLSFRRRLYAALPVLAAPALAFFLLDGRLAQVSKNEYANEVAMNGLYAFGSAFINNELPYDKFYAAIEPAAAFKSVRAALAGPGAEFTDEGLDINRRIKARGPLKKLNVVVLVEESLSAEYLQAFGGTRGAGTLANLDALAARSLFFRRYYAAGTRTVRGLEAMTLSIPPLPGTSIVKRPDNGNFFSWGSVMRDLGYVNKYIYAGFGYFDNMNAFYSGNGFEIVDRANFSKDEISFANIWGVCDGDLLARTLREADADFKAGKPFFYMVMTTTNHRPFTYPDGKIDIPSSSQGRRGALKYSDYAIGEFLAAAGKKPWFKDTVFVITADHCANSAGKAEIPVRNYHIPLFIYSPAHVKPAMVETLAAQADLAPTVLGLMNASYESRFFGRDMLAGRPQGRAFLSTFQKMGLLTDGAMAVLGPKKYLKTYKWDEAGKTVAEVPDDKTLEQEAVSFYQSANYIYKRRLNRLK
ncbi:MAG TPA: sulfatase-like hydrolase/transferase [Elusimicrobiales bacterium]|nr:sulfatase-like hydrolase/transferase [Elusimicrobiales bacterium]